MGDMFEVLASTTPAGHAAATPRDRQRCQLLASDEASFIHGAVLPADGGRVAV